MLKLSIIIPLYKSEYNIESTYNIIFTQVIPQLDDYEIIFIDDRSPDNSYKKALEIRNQNDQVKIIKLSKNFGQHIAICSGLANMSGNCAVVISADLQDPPELILQMLEKYKNGSKVVIAVRTARNEGFLQKLSANIYYKIMQKFALKETPLGGFDCFLADKSVTDILVNMQEKNTSLFSQVLWLGYDRSEVYYTREARTIGKSGWTFAKKIKLVIDSILGFSYMPIRIISTIGLIDCVLSFLYAAYIVINKIFFGGEMGWASLMTAIMFTSGVQMLTLGIIGEYLWRNFDESKKRPLYIIDEKHGIN